MKDIEGYEGLYGVTSCGRIWSFKSKKFLKPHIQRDGYMLVTLYKDKISKTFQVHRLVAKAFISNPNNLPEVNHIDGIKTNNNVQNLEFCSHSYNMRHSYKIGLREREVEQMKARNCKKVKCIETGQIFNSGKEAAEVMGLDASHISKVCRGKAKSHKGYHFEFVEEVIVNEVA